MKVGRASFTLTVLGSGQVLATGGCGGYFCTSVYASAERYDPSTGKWSSTGAMTRARTRQTAVLLPSGQVLVAGGTDSSGYALASAELYKPTTNAFSPAPAMHLARTGATATALADGRVLEAGGGPIAAEVSTP